MTYNIHKGFSAGNTRFVLHSMRKAMVQIEVDLIFLQEIQGEHAYRERFIDDWPDIPQLQFLAVVSGPTRPTARMPFTTPVTTAMPS